MADTPEPSVPTEIAAAPAPPTLPEGTVTFLFTDLEGSTALLAAHPAAYREALVRHHALLRGAVEAHRGTVFETVGDAVYAAFARPTDAVAAALAGQLALYLEPWGETGPLRARMGVHLGEVERQGGHYFGAPLYRCARLTAAAHGGQTVLSAAVAEVVGDALPAGAGLVALGEHRLKDLAKPERVAQLVHPDVPAEFPPLRSLDAVPNNLPRQRTPLIGREHEVAAVVERLMRPETPLLTLNGPGGTGKTRLALQAAAELVDRFAAGVYFVPLASVRDPALVATAVARALGLDEPPGPGRTPLDVLCQFLRDRPLLLVLDNFEQVLAGARDVAHILEACSLVKILVTSREVLHLREEHVFPVPPLALPDLGRAADSAALVRAPAVAFYFERAQAVRPDLPATETNVRAAAEICARLDGLPLAIELAAARSTSLTPPAILARLRGWLDLLTRGAQDAPDRHRTMRQAIGWSYDLLPARERTLFHRLAVFGGGAALDAVEAVCGEGCPPGEILDDLTALVEKSLLIVELIVEDATGEEPRYRMLAPVREFALERLAAAGEAESVRARHAAHFFALAEAADQELRRDRIAELLDRLELEHDNLRLALEWDPSGPQEAEAALRAGAALMNFWILRGHLREGQRRLAALLTRPETQAPTQGRARALGAAGLLALWQGDDDVTAERLLEESLALARQLDDTRITAYALRGLGELAQRRGDAAGALAQFQESLALAREAGDANGMRWSLEDLADLAAERGAADEAAPLYEQALGLARQEGDQHSIAALLRSVGELAHAHGDQARASATLRESLAISRALRDRTCGALCLDSLARVLGAQCQSQRAVGVFAAASALREATGMAVPAAKRAVRDSWVATARGPLDGPGFAAAWAQGSALDFTQAVAFALAADPPAAPAAPSAPIGPSGAGGRARPASGDDPMARLTPREREVALLVARGLTSREIAATLVVTERTAETHVEHILAKLDFHARTQIATWVGEHGLLAAAPEPHASGESLDAAPSGARRRST